MSIYIMSDHALIIILLQITATTPMTSEVLGISTTLAPRSPSTHTTPPSLMPSPLHAHARKGLVKRVALMRPGRMQ